MNVNQAISALQECDVSRPTRLAAGIALSLLVHMLLLFTWRQGMPVQRPDELPTHTAIAVWLCRMPPPVPALPKAEPAPPATSASRRFRAAAQKRRTAPDVIALPPPREPDATPAPPEFTVEPPEPAAPRFDPEAARRMARQLANEPDPAKAGTAVAQLPRKPLATETKAERAIASAKRRDCKDGIPGGLLAPLYLMMDKKDSGCKW